ncbi:MAG: AAA family ATPase, partial [Myxococcales bacterium]|nr:AAA family ATPase [Myxococcales bacterium]
GPGLLRDAQRSGVPDDYDGDDLLQIESDQVTARPQLSKSDTSRQRSRARRRGRRYADAAASWRDEHGDPRHQPTEVSVSNPPESARPATSWDVDDQANIDTADGDPRPEPALTGGIEIEAKVGEFARDPDLRATAESAEPQRLSRSPAALRATADSLRPRPLEDDTEGDIAADEAFRGETFREDSPPPPHMVPTATGEDDDLSTPRPGLDKPRHERPGASSLTDDELDDLDVIEEIALEDIEESTQAPRTERSQRDAKVAPQADDAPTPALGERKRCVVVAARLDCSPALRDEAERLTADIAYKLEGQLHETDEEGLVVLFGLPVGHENDIVSAVRFAFDAEEAVRHLGVESTASGVRAGGESGNVSLRCGIRAGTARLSGQPAKEGYLVLGNSVREAQALAEHAEEGQTLIAGAAARLAATHYQLRELAPIKRQGKSIRRHRVVAPHSGERDRRIDSSDPLIGREMETKAMRSIWREAVMRSEQRSLLIVGDPGIGKSRLVDEFLLRYCGEAAVVTAAASPHRVETPYSLVASVLRGITGVWSSGTSRGRARLIDRLRSLLDRVLFEDGGDAEQALDALAAVIDPGTMPVGDAGSGFAKSRVYRALRQVLHAAGNQRPIVLVVEDLHWADSASIECLRALVSRPEDTRGALLVLATARPDEGGSDGHSLLEDAGVSSVVLEELDEGARGRLIVNLLGEHGVDEVIEGVEQRAGGNPFFIRELCDAIKELGGGVTGIPETVQGVILGRVDRLPTQVKVVLQYATVIGPTFREGILTRLLSRNPARSLAELRNRGVLVPGVDMAVPFTNAGPGGPSEQFERQWSFRHVLVQELIYQGINLVDRRTLHRRIGEIMMRRSERGSTDPPAEIGRHLELGGLTEQAAVYYVRAAHKAAAAYANIEAVDLFARALRLCGEQKSVEYDAYAGRERVYGRLGLHDEQAADLRRLGKLSGDDPKRRADLRAREAVHLLRLGQLYRALEAAEQAEAASDEAGDRLLKGEALRLRGEAYGRLNDHARAEHAVTAALEIFEGEGAVQHQVRARIALGRIHLVQANYDEAFRHYDPALELIKQTGDRWQERVLRNNLAVVHYCRGDFSRALDEAHYSLELCRQYADRAREGDNSSVVGIVSLELGLYEQARNYIEEALAIHRETGSAWSEADTLVYAGLLDAATGDTERALAQLEEAKAIAEEMGAKYIAVNARNAIALVLADRNDPGDAAKAVDEATEAFESAGQAQLIVGEIPGLSRAARATALLGDLDAARALSRRAVELLDEQKAIESSEEEIYYTHYRILEARGDDGREYLERAHSGFVGKMALIDDSDARAAYSDRVRLNVAIRRDYVGSDLE